MSKCVNMIIHNTLKTFVKQFADITKSCLLLPKTTVFL